MSVLTRVVGYGLCLAGAFSIGYSQGVQSVIGSIAGLVVAEASSFVPNVAPQINAAIVAYIQQNVTANINYYLGAGFAAIVPGIIIVAIGDRKSKKEDSIEEAPKAMSVTVGSQAPSSKN